MIETQTIREGLDTISKNPNQKLVVTISTTNKNSKLTQEIYFCKLKNLIKIKIKNLEKIKIKNLEKTEKKYKCCLNTSDCFNRLKEYINNLKKENPKATVTIDSVEVKTRKKGQKESYSQRSTNELSPELQAKINKAIEQLKKGDSSKPNSQYSFREDEDEDEDFELDEMRGDMGEDMDKLDDLMETEDEEDEGSYAMKHYSCGRAKYGQDSFSDEGMWGFESDSDRSYTDSWGSDEEEYGEEDYMQESFI